MTYFFNGYRLKLGTWLIKSIWCVILWLDQNLLHCQMNYRNYAMWFINVKLYQKIKVYQTNFISFTTTFDSPEKRIDTLRNVNLWFNNKGFISKVQYLQITLCFHFIFDRLTKFRISGGVGSRAISDRHSSDEEEYENQKLKNKIKLN